MKLYLGLMESLMQKVLNAQKLSLIALVLLGFTGTPLVVAQDYDLPVQIDRSAVSRENRPESSAMTHTKVNAIAAQYIPSIGGAGDPTQAVKHPQEVTQRISPLRLAVDLSTEESALQQRRKGEEEKWRVRQPTFPELDINHDGVISREEAKRWDTLDKKFEQIDKDGNHKIDRSEFLEFETKQLKESILDFSRGK